MTTKSLNFPVVIFGTEPSATFDISVDEASLLTTTPLTLKRGIYYDSIIVDAQGCSYRVESVRRLQQTPVQGFVENLLNTPIKVDMQLMSPTSMELLDFKARLTAAFQNQTFAEVWQDAGLDMRDFQSFLDRSNSFNDIILYLLEKTGSDNRGIAQ